MIRNLQNMGRKEEDEIAELAPLGLVP